MCEIALFKKKLNHSPDTGDSKTCVWNMLHNMNFAKKSIVLTKRFRDASRIFLVSVYVCCEMTINIHSMLVVLLLIYLQRITVHKR